MFPTEEMCFKVAILAIDFLSRGLFNFLKGGAMFISVSSSSGYASNNSLTVVEGVI